MTYLVALGNEKKNHRYVVRYIRTRSCRVARSPLARVNLLDASGARVLVSANLISDLKGNRKGYAGIYFRYFFILVPRIVVLMRGFRENCFSISNIAC